MVRKTRKLHVPNMPHAGGFLEEADELGDALETWSDATNQYWVKV